MIVVGRSQLESELSVVAKKVSIVARVQMWLHLSSRQHQLVVCAVFCASKEESVEGCRVWGEDVHTNLRSGIETTSEWP